MQRILQFTSYAPLEWDGKPEATTPDYPKFGANVAKYRKLPATPENVKAHFAALMSQLRTIQRNEFKADIVEPERKSPCISGTWLSDGNAIMAAIRAQHIREIEGALSESWRKRTNAQVKAAYEAAMKGEESPLTYLI